MNLNLKVIKYVGRGFALGVIAILAFYYYVYTQVCANTVLVEALSPDGNWKAVLFERGCGPYTGNSTQISLLKAADPLPNDAGNIYVAEDGAAGYTLSWLTDTAVRVSGVRGVNHLRLEKYQGIEVRYEAAGGRAR